LSTTTTAEPLNKYKHALIVAILAAAGHFLVSLAGAPGIPADAASFLSVLGGEVLIYDHSA
jgi:hypothetical protein